MLYQIAHYSQFFKKNALVKNTTYIIANEELLNVSKLNIIMIIGATILFPISA